MRSNRPFFQLRKRILPVALTSLVCILGLATPTSAEMNGPSCFASNSGFSMSTNEVDSPTFKVSCETVGQQGYYGGPCANQQFSYGLYGWPSSYACTSISSQVTYGYAGNLYSGSRSYQTTIGNWSSSTGPSYGGLFAGRYWTTVAGLGEEFHVDTFVSGFNC